jgi:mono/diheme cytochrome c family protein
MKSLRLIALSSMLVLTGISFVPHYLPGISASQNGRVDFARDIQPIFEANCNSCHNAKKASGQLRLDVRALAMKGGISGAVIIPGNSRQSRLMQRILGAGGEQRMPLKSEPLEPQQIELIRRWIDEGAKWDEPNSELRTANAELPKHWAYIKPVRPTIPAVKNSAWVRNPIDAFILARLEREGLQPAPEASRETLLRRVYLDLIGLPPSPQEMDEFLADNSPNAYEKVVDRLLQSPHYGERWARPWLDLSRYADSNGYEKDNLRVMWKYRDWVINALNADMPFDQFTIEQMAGDMLPNATIEQRIATGFHRNTLLNQEGGIDPEEARYEVLVDRVNTTSTVWLGSTLGCAQCHNHKYDPFTQREYFQLYAFFENSDYQVAWQSEGVDSSRYVREPILELPTTEQEKKRAALRAEIAAVELKLKTQTPELDKAELAWEKEMQEQSGKWSAVNVLSAKSTGGATLTKQADQSLLASGEAPEFDEYLITARSPLRKITGIRLEAMPDASLPRGGPGRDLYGHFVLSAIEAELNGAEIKLTNGNWDDGLSRFEAKSFFEKTPMGQIADRPRGWLINAMNDETRLSRNAVFTPDKALSLHQDDELKIRLKFNAGGLCQSIGRLKVWVTDTKKPLQLTGISARLRPVLSLPMAQRSEKQQKDLASRFREATPLLDDERAKLKELKTSLDSLGIVTALVMQEKESRERPSTFLRIRGGFMSPGEKVSAGTPAAFHPMPEKLPVNRMGLAQWLVDDNNPIVARVAVNRFWEAFFGRGIVETSEDFGMQGQLPSHPELLNWLSVAFRDGSGEALKAERGMLNTKTAASQELHRSSFIPHRWGLKSLHRLIVTSSTYRQASDVSSQLLEKDPYNRLLARGPRFRMEAEMVRDAMLTASGLLSRRIGGPSVMPPQPEGIWRNPYSGAKWIPSTGENRYRRGLYTFLRRTSPYPAMMTFDATSREVCTVRRVRTNTPLQSLTLLNDETSMDMARALVTRMFAEAGGETKAQMEYGFRLCTSRRPNAAETERLMSLYQQQIAHYSLNNADAAKLVHELRSVSGKVKLPELAAWTVIANVLLNLDETLTKQ